MTREMDKILSIKEKDNLMQNYIWETPEEINLKIAYELYANNSKISDSEIEIDLSRV